MHIILIAGRLKLFALIFILPYIKLDRVQYHGLYTNY